jgi:hypothetical protein
MVARRYREFGHHRERERRPIPRDREKRWFEAPGGLS